MTSSAALSQEYAQLRFRVFGAVNQIPHLTTADVERVLATIDRAQEIAPLVEPPRRGRRPRPVLVREQSLFTEILRLRRRLETLSTDQPERQVVAA